MEDAKTRPRPAGSIRFILLAAGIAAITLGCLAITFGSLWASGTLEFFAASPIGRAFELVVPFLPILLIAFGAFLLIKSRRSSGGVSRP